MAEPIEVLIEANRILRGGGVVLIVDFPRNSLAQRLWNEDYHTAAEVDQMLHEAGFADVECELIAREQLIWGEAVKALAGKETP